MKRLPLAVVLLAVLGALGWIVYQAISEEDVGTTGSGAQAEADEKIGKLTGEQQKEAAAASREASRKKLDIGDGSTELAITGRLVFADGRPGADIAMQFIKLPLDPSGMPPRTMRPFMEDQNRTRVMTDGEGRFSFVTTPETLIVVRLSDDRAAFTGSAVRNVRAQNESVDVGDWKIQVAATIVGTVVDESGALAEGVAVQVRAPGQMAFGSTRKGKRTDGQGVFKLGGLTAGEYELVTASPRYMPGRLKVKVEAGQNKTDVTITVRAGAKITGVVKDDLGQPIADATVTVRRERQIGGQISIETTTPGEGVRTDADGTFELGGLAGPMVQIVARSDAHRQVELNVKPGARDVQIVMDRLARISGVLVDTAGKPIEGSLVSTGGRRLYGIELGLPGSGVPTDEKGRFDVAGVPPGRVTLKATGEHLPVKHGLTVKPGEHVVDLRIVAQAGASLQVTLRGANDEPVPNAEVSLRKVKRAKGWQIGHPDRRVRRRVERRVEANDSGDVRILGNGDVLGRATTDAEGIALFKGLPAGLIEVHGRHTHYTMEPAKVELPSEGLGKCRVSMFLGGFANVTVVDTAGKPLAKTEVRLRGPRVGDKPGKSTKGRTGDQGECRLGPLQPGVYTATILAEDKPMRGEGMSIRLAGQDNALDDSKVELRIRADEASRVKLAMPVLTRVHGVVRDAKGPALGVRVSLQREDGAMLPFLGRYSARTDKEGHYEITGVSSGKYQVMYARRNATLPAVEKLELARNVPDVRKDLVLQGGILRVTVYSEVEEEPLESVLVSISRVRENADGGQNVRNEVRMIGISATADGSGAPGISRMNMSSAGRTRTDADGVAEVNDMPAGKFEVTIKHAGHKTLRKTFDHPGQGVLDLGTLKLAAGGTIRVSLSFGKAAGMMRVTELELMNVKDKDTQTEISTSSKHRFDGLAAGKYRIRARKMTEDDPGWSKWVDIEVELGKTVRATVAVPD